MQIAWMSFHVFCSPHEMMINNETSVLDLNFLSKLVFEVKEYSINFYELKNILTWGNFPIEVVVIRSSMKEKWSFLEDIKNL